MSSFFIVSTVTGSYYVGLLGYQYNSVNLVDNPIRINDVIIPYSNIDYIRTDVKPAEYFEICKNLGIENQRDYKKSLIDFDRSLLNRSNNLEWK